MRGVLDPIGHRSARDAATALALALAVALAACSHDSSSGPTCTATCTLGETRCGSANATVEACGTGPDGCPAWMASTICDAGTPCAVGPSGAACGSVPPIASFSATPPAGPPPLSVLFDATGSTDPDGTIVSYAWSFGDGGTGSTAVVTHGYANAGTYTVTLTVTDDSGATGSTSGVIVVGAAAVDPLYASQWHLKNTGQSHGGVTAVAGIDVNAEPVWGSCAGNATCRGEGALIRVVDTGVQIAHPDLAPNVAPGASHNYLNGTSDPTPAPGSPPEYAHGTAVAGIVAARDLNGLGGRGVAPRASLAGYNFLAAQSVSNLADSMSGNAAAVSVNTNSWGPESNGELSPSEDAWKAAIETGLSSGRGGRGLVYTFAAGNGAPNDDSNYDGYANYRGVMAVGAVNALGVKSSYSSEGANLWIAAPGGEFCSTLAITTTDLMGSAGFNAGGPPGNDLADGNYTQCMNGTSSATPNVAGVAALVVQANPNLSWRDVRLVLGSTARKIDALDSDWTTNGAGFHVSHKYGFGLVDANAAVALAKTWTNVPGLVTCTSPLRQPNLAIPDAPVGGGLGAPVQDTLTVSGCAITSIEFVEVLFSAADHTYMGDLDVRLSHDGTPTVSRLARTHVCQDQIGNPPRCTTRYGNNTVPWVFGTTHHLGESPVVGTWTLTVQDGAPVDTGHLQSWQLIFYGH